MSELLSMLTAKSPPLFLSGQGASDGLTPQMVAASLNGLPVYVYLYGLLKFTSDMSVRNEFLSLAKDRILNQAHDEGWVLANTEPEERIVRLGLLAALQAVNPVCCLSCSGRGADNKNLTCRSCGGSGIRKGFSQRTLAKILNVSHKRVRSFWMAKYRDQESLYLGFDIDIHDHVRKGLKEK